MGKMKKNKILLLIIVTFSITVSLFRQSSYNGIDVSHHNDLKWENIPEQVHFCYIKLTEGTTFIDPKHDYHTRGATKYDMNIGYYHFFRTNKSGKEQFEHFSKQLDNLHYSLIPVIDVENHSNTHTKQSRKELEIFINCFYEKYGYHPIIYYGDLNSYFKNRAVTKDCRYWFRVLPGFNIRQSIIPRKIEGIPIDVNYCSDIYSITIYNKWIR